MKSKAVQLWQSEERQLERVTGAHPPTDLLEWFCGEHRGEPVTLVFTDGQKVPVVLLGTDARSRVVAVGRPPFLAWLLVHKSTIVGVATE